MSIVKSAFICADSCFIGDQYFIEPTCVKIVTYISTPGILSLIKFDIN